MRTALLIDLDDTLYDYAPSERLARAAVLQAVVGDSGLPPAEVAAGWTLARETVKSRLGETGAGHSRLLYLAELVFVLDRPALLRRVRAWERLYWTQYLRDVRLRPFALQLLAGWRARGTGARVAVVTDLLLEVQLWKLEALGLFPHVDVLVASEEVGRNKPGRAIFELAMARLAVGPEHCVMVGDNPHKDGQGARELGIPYYQAQSSEKPGGQSLQDIARALEDDR